MFKDLDAEQGIPGGSAFGEGMGFARQGRDTVTQAPVKTLQMDRARGSDEVAQRRFGFDRAQVAPHIAMRDRLGQLYVLPASRVADGHAGRLAAGGDTAG